MEADSNNSIDWETIDPDREFQVDKIVAKLIPESGPVKYFVKWKGFDDEDNTWESVTQLNPEQLAAVAAYEEKLQLQGPPKKLTIKSEPGECQSAPTAIAKNQSDTKIYAECILNKKMTKNNRIKYLVLWSNGINKHKSWELAVNLKNYANLISCFENGYRHCQEKLKSFLEFQTDNDTTEPLYNEIDGQLQNNAPPQNSDKVSVSEVNTGSIEALEIPVSKTSCAQVIPITSTDTSGDSSSITNTIIGYECNGQDNGYDNIVLRAPVYRCDVCKASFSTRNQLMRHKVNHPNVKSWKCRFCGKKFGKGGHRDRHELKVCLKKTSNRELQKQKSWQNQAN